MLESVEVARVRHCACVEIKGQLPSIDSLLPGTELRFGGKFHYTLKHLGNPGPFTDTKLEGKVKGNEAVGQVDFCRKSVETAAQAGQRPSQRRMPALCKGWGAGGLGS